MLVSLVILVIIGQKDSNGNNPFRPNSELEKHERVFRVVYFQMAEGALQVDRRCPVARGTSRCMVSAPSILK